MAPRKLPAKRSRKDKAAEGTSATPEFDNHRFRSAEHQQRFEAIKGWSFHRERRVQLWDDEEVIAQLLCIPGQDFARTTAGRRVRIMRTNMNTLTQTWMMLQLSNILPSDHNSDLPLPKCQLVYAILTWMSVHVAQLIADAIYLFAGMPLSQHAHSRASKGEAHGCAFQRRKDARSHHQRLFVENIGKTEGNRSK